MPAVITCDLFSALLDSRSGATAAMAQWGRDWPVAPQDVYDRWDALNKGLQRDCTVWVPFAELSRRALATAYAELRVPWSADDDVELLLGSASQWPLWPDVAPALPALQQVARVGVLSNVDDAVLRATRVAPLVDLDLALTSERLRAYKPRLELYRAARIRLGPFLHVASSARDVRGALEAGVDVVRLVRPGHPLDPAGPVPEHELASLLELPALLPALGLR